MFDWGTAIGCCFTLPPENPDTNGVRFRSEQRPASHRSASVCKALASFTAAQVGRLPLVLGRFRYIGDCRKAAFIISNP